MVNNLNAEALRNALVVASMEYCKKYLEGQNVDKTEDIKAQIAKLEANGLGRTKNAEVLRTLLTAKGSSKSRDEIASLIGRIKEVSPSCMIVPYDDFFKVLKKYNLACGPISTYKGVIPEENIEAIVKAGKELHKIKNINNMQWVPRIDIDSDMPKSIVNEIVEYFSRFPFVVDGISSGWQYMRAIGHPEVGKFTVESREYDILGGTCSVILDKQITWTEASGEYNDAMLAYKKHYDNTIDLLIEDFFKLLQDDSKLQAVKHVKESAKCSLREAKDFVDTYRDYVLND